MNIFTYGNANTLGITFVHDEIREHHYDKLMGIPESEIECVDGCCDIRFVFQVTSQHRYDHIYGNINKCQSYFHRYGKYCDLTKSRHRIVWIDLKGHIPLIIDIKET